MVEVPAKHSISASPQTFFLLLSADSPEFSWLTGQSSLGNRCLCNPWKHMGCMMACQQGMIKHSPSSHKFGSNIQKSNCAVHPFIVLIAFFLYLESRCSVYYFGIKIKGYKQTERKLWLAQSEAVYFMSAFSLLGGSQIVSVLKNYKKTKKVQFFW